MHIISTTFFFLHFEGRGISYINVKLKTQSSHNLEKNEAANQLQVTIILCK